MITSLRLIDFKNFADEKLRMGPFTVVVGTNASGKSNLRDAFRILHGIGRGYNLADAFGGRYGVGGQVEWNQVRGAFGEIIRFGRPAFELQVEADVEQGSFSADFSSDFDVVRRVEARYSMGIGNDQQKPGTFRVVRESLDLGGLEPIYTSNPPPPDPVGHRDDDEHLWLRMAKAGKQKKYGTPVAVRPDQPALTQIREQKKVRKSHKDAAAQMIDVLGSMRFLDLAPESMRQPAFPGQTILGDSGENLPAVLKDICADSNRRETLAEWTRELTPMDVRDFEFPTDPTTGKVQLAFRESGGRAVSAYVASDGTLRFLAMLAALLGASPARLYFFEEIDNGIHPSRLRLLADLIERCTETNGVQVVATTHSPDLLSMIGDETFGNTSVVCRRPDTDAAVVRPVAELPDAGKLREAQGLGRLHASGWMEDAIFFTEGIEDEQEHGA